MAQTTPRITINRDNEKLIPQFFKDPSVLELLANGEIESILKNKEDAIIQCGGKFQPLFSIRKTSKSAHMVVDPQFAGLICQGSPQAIIHYHGPYLSALSSADRNAHKTFFRWGFHIGCAIGVDGFSCQTATDEFKIPWNDDFYEFLRKKHIPVLENVDTISCIGEKKTKECTIYFNDGADPYTNMFQDVLSEYSDGPFPHMWFDKDSVIPERRVLKQLKQTCITPLTNKKNRILTCFNQMGD